MHALFNHLTNQLRLAVKLGKSMDFLTFMNVMSGVTPQVLSYQLAGVLDIKPSERQQLLEEPSVKGRLEKESGYLSKEVKVLELEKKIATKTQEKFEKNVKEQVLRERIKTIEKELGEDDENKDTKELMEKVKKLVCQRKCERKQKRKLND